MRVRELVAVVVAHLAAALAAVCVLLVGLELAFWLGGPSPVAVSLWLLLLCGFVLRADR